MSSGSSASARAMAMRCSWPPENCGGRRRRSIRSSPTKESSSRMRASWLPGRHDGVRLEGFAHDLGDRHARVERGQRVLEDRLQPAAHRQQPARPGVRDVVAVEADAPARRLDEAQRQPRQGGLAAAALADQPDGLAPARPRARRRRRRAPRSCRRASARSSWSRPRGRAGRPSAQALRRAVMPSAAIGWWQASCTPPSGRRPARAVRQSSCA